MDQLVTTEIVDRVAVIRFDDGKANALCAVAIDALHAALDEAESEAASVALIGRTGVFCAGFDLTVMSGPPEAARVLVTAGARLATRIYGFPIPVVAGCTGHALAAGAILLLASDLRLGIDGPATNGPATIGLNEVSIGMPLPVFAVELARDRLSRRHFTRATALAGLYSPADAIDVGYLDDVCAPEDHESSVVDWAAHAASHVEQQAFAQTRINTRQATIDHIHATLDRDMETFEVRA